MYLTGMDTRQKVRTPVLDGKERKERERESITLTINLFSKYYKHTYIHSYIYSYIYIKINWHIYTKICTNYRQTFTKELKTIKYIMPMIMKARIKFKLSYRNNLNSSR